MTSEGTDSTDSLVLCAPQSVGHSRVDLGESFEPGGRFSTLRSFEAGSYPRASAHRWDGPGQTGPSLSSAEAPTHHTQL